MPPMTKADLRACILAHIEHPRVLCEDTADAIMDHIDDYERSQWRKCSDPPDTRRKVLVEWSDGAVFVCRWTHERMGTARPVRWRDLPTYEPETTPPSGSVDE